MQMACRHLGVPGLIMVMQQEENSLKGPETLQKIVPYQPYYGVRWKGLEAVRYRTSSTGASALMTVRARPASRRRADAPQKATRPPFSRTCRNSGATRASSGAFQRLP